MRQCSNQPNLLTRSNCHTNNDKQSGITERIHISSSHLNAAAHKTRGQESISFWCLSPSGHVYLTRMCYSCIVWNHILLNNWRTCKNADFVTLLCCPYHISTHQISTLSLTTDFIAYKCFYIIGWAKRILLVFFHPKWIVNRLEIVIYPSDVRLALASSSDCTIGEIRESAR